MVDATAIVTAGDDTEYDLFNVAIILLAFFTSFAVVTFGIQQSMLPVIVLGLAFAVLVLGGVVFTDGRLLKSPATFAQAALAYWAARGIFHISTFTHSGSLSLFSTPTGSYLSVLAQAPVYIRGIVNRHWAPWIENAGIISAVALLFLALRQAGVDDMPALAVATATGAAAFAGIHGVRSLGFFLFAFVFMAAIAGTIVGVDAGLIEVPFIAVGMAGGYGAHSGHNFVASGVGLLQHYSQLLAAPEPFVYVGWAITAFDAVTLVAAVLAAYELVVGDVSVPDVSVPSMD